jgi:hypothetical protein
MLAYYGPEWESLQSRMVGRWCPSFTGNTGLQLPDTSGFGNHGVLTNLDRNTSWQTNPDKLALSSPGTPFFVDIPNAPQLNPTKQIAFSVWCNTRVGSSSFTYCLLSKSTSVNAQPYPAFDIRGAGGGIWEVALAIGATSRTISLRAMIANEWTHLLFSYDGTTLAGYRNGLLTGSLAVTGDIGTTTNPLRLFENAGFPGRFSNALIDDITFYNAGLTVSEVRFIYEQGRGGGMLYQPPRRRSVAAIIAALVLACETGNYSLTGQEAGLFASRLLAADQAQFLLSGNAANITASRLLSMDPASYTATGNDAATICARLLDGGAAAYALTGTDAGLIANRKLTADQAVCFLAGNNAELLRSLKLNAGSMALQLDNFAASLLANRKISADGAQYILVVSDANLTGSASGVAPYYYLFMLRGPQ